MSKYKYISDEEFTEWLKLRLERINLGLMRRDYILSQKTIAEDWLKISAVHLSKILTPGNGQYAIWRREYIDIIKKKIKKY